MIAVPGRSRRIGIGIAAATAALLGLTGCAAGQHSQTAAQTPILDGVEANVGDIGLRAVTVAAPTDFSYAKGSEATLQLVLVNNGTVDDRLTGVTTPAAGTVRLYANANDAAPTEAASPTGAAPTTPGGSTTPGASTTPATPSATATPGSSAATASAQPTPIESITLPAGRAISIGYTPDLPVIQLEGLTNELFPSDSFPITFTFARAGSVTFSVAVHLAPGPSTTPTEDIAPSAE